MHPRLLLPALLLLSFTLGACGGAGDADRPDALNDMGIGGAGGTGMGAAPCDDGSEKTCKVTIEQANGQKSCFTGTQYCEEGKWSPCFDPEYDPYLP